MARKKAPTKKATQAEPDLEGLVPRDWLAANVMSGLCASRSQHPVGSIADTAQELAAVSYIIADQMAAMRLFDSSKLKQWLMAKRVSTHGMVAATPPVEVK